MYDAAAQQAISLARKLKNKYGDAESICIAKDIHILFTALSRGVTGLHVHTHRMHTIAIQKSLDPYLTRFIIGHELGHYFMDKARNKLYIDPYISKNNYIERRADIFSAALILPEKIPEEFADYTSAQLARYYGIPTWTVELIYRTYFF